MRTFIKSLAFAGAIAISLNATAPAATVSITLKPLHSQTAKSPLVGVTALCANPNRDARVASVFFEMPAIAEGQGATGTAGIAIQLSETGSLISESIFQPSGNPNLDRAALLSARMSRFVPEVSNCSAVGGSYLYTVTF